MSLSAFTQAPVNDLIQNATLITSFPFNDVNVQLGNATTSPGGENGCSVSFTFPTIFYKFNVDNSSMVSVGLEDADGGTILTDTSFAIIYSSPTLSASSPSQLTVVSSCVYGTETNIEASPGVNYYVVIYRDTSTGLNTNISFNATVNTVPQSERDALIAFYNATGGDNWTNNTNWNTSEPVSTWYGVTTQNINGTFHVTELNPNVNNLNGTFPSEITALTELRQLWIQNNYLTGEIPSNIGDLTNLTQFVLNNNFGMTGSIPESFNNCTNLELLMLQNHQFEGPLPDFTGLANLSSLWIGFNNFEFGDFENEFPTYQANMGTNFTYSNQGLVDTASNQIAAIGNIITLTSNTSGSQNNYQWYKDGNVLSGETNANLEITINSINDYGDYHYLVTSNIVTNLTLESEIFTISPEPSSSPDYDALVALYNSTNGNNWTTNTNWLDNNQPLDNWHGITIENNRVTYISLGNNNLTGTLPSEIGDFSELTVLSLWSNQLEGEIPSEIGNLSNLIELDLSPNTFSGEIPQEICNLTNLEILWLNQNGLSGNIPLCFQNLTSLRELHLIGSALPPYLSSTYSGDFPDLTGLPLEILDIRFNYFTFIDIADEFSTYENNISFFDYSPQWTLDPEEDIMGSPGNDILLTLTDVPSTRTSGTRLASNNYQWFKDNVAISGATSNTHTISNAQVSDSGIYYCEISNPDVPGFIIRRSDINVSIGTLGIEDTTLNTLKLVPNPTDGIIHVDLPENTTNVLITVYNIYGKRVLSQNIDKTNAFIDITKYSSGLYLVKLKIDNKSYIKKIIKE